MKMHMENTAVVIKRRQYIAEVTVISNLMLTKIHAHASTYTKHIHANKTRNVKQIQ